MKINQPPVVVCYLYMGLCRFRVCVRDIGCSGLTESVCNARNPNNDC